MKITLNPDAEIVKTVREGLKRTGGYCPCRLQRTEDTKCMCKEFREQIADPDFEGFCQMVREEVPNHGHLPVVKDLQRMEVDSFTRSVVLWDEKNAPVQGKRFRKYKEIARKTEDLLMK